MNMHLNSKYTENDNSSIYLGEINVFVQNWNFLGFTSFSMIKWFAGKKKQNFLTKIPISSYQIHVKKDIPCLNSDGIRFAYKASVSDLKCYKESSILLTLRSENKSLTMGHRSPTLNYCFGDIVRIQTKEQIGERNRILC